MRPLKPKQNLFVQEYLVDKNATRAAKAAGYSAKTAYSIGQENLRKPDIRKAVEIGLKAQTDKADCSAEKVLKELAHIAFDFKGSNAGKLRALELLGKYHGLFTNRIEVTGNNSGPQVIAYIPDNGKAAKLS